VDGWEDEFLLFGGGKDLIQINRNAEGDEEESSDSRADPVGWLEGRWSDELRPEGGAALGEKAGIFF